MMTNQRTKLIVAVFIVIASSSSADLIERPDNVQAKCHSNGSIEVTQSKSASYGSLFYQIKGTTEWVHIPISVDKYVIPAGDIKNVNIRFSPKDKKVFTYGFYEIDCTTVSKTGMILSLSVTTPEVVTVYATSDVKMSLDPPSFDLQSTSQLTIVLPDTFAKAIIDTCEIADVEKPNDWIPIHECKKAGNNIIDKIELGSDNKTLTATFMQIQLGDATSMRLRCVYAACKKGDCATMYDTDYTDNKCKA